MTYTFLARDMKTGLTAAVGKLVDGVWHAQTGLVRSVENELRRRKLDPAKPGDLVQLPRIYSGGYFWCTSSDTPGSPTDVSRSNVAADKATSSPSGSLF